MTDTVSLANIHLHVLCSVMSDPLGCHGLQSTRLLCLGILQARILEWAAMPSSRGSSQPRDWTQVSHTAGGFFTVWATRETQEYCSGEPIPSSGELPDPGMESGFPVLQAESLPAELPGKPYPSSYIVTIVFFNTQKSKFYSYTLTINYPSRKSRKQSQLWHQKE